MAITPILAHGGAMPPLMGIGFCALSCIIGGLVLAANSKTTGQCTLGALLSCLGALIVILTMLFLDKLIRLFA